MATDRDSVLEAAVGVLSRRPTAHLDEIARAAGISRATLHRVFPGREALIREVGALGLRRFATALDTAQVEEGDAEAALRRLVDAVVPDAALCAFLAGENQLYDDEEINDLWEFQDARVRALFLRGQQEGVFRVELSTGWLSEAFFDLVAGIGWAVQEGRLAPRESAFSLAELFLGGALRRDPRRSPEQEKPWHSHQEQHQEQHQEPRQEPQQNPQRNLQHDLEHDPEPEKDPRRSDIP